MADVTTQMELPFDEEWRDVIGWEGYYQVSNLGRVRGVARTISHPTKGKMRRQGIILSLSKSTRGYVQAHLKRDGKTKNAIVHQLVARAFIGERPEGYDINHKDGDKQNNSPSNLEYVTHQENMQHAWDTGLKQPSYILRKLTSEQVVEIRRLQKTGMTGVELGKIFGVCGSVISRIVLRKTWKDIP